MSRDKIAALLLTILALSLSACAGMTSQGPLEQQRPAELQNPAEEDVKEKNIDVAHHEEKTATEEQLRQEETEAEQQSEKT